MKEKNDLTQEVLKADYVNSGFLYDSVAGGMTPARLAGVIRDANEGNPQAYFTLAEEMEERDAHYGTVIRQRKLAVAAIEPVVEAASDSPQDEKMADFIRELIGQPQFEDVISDLTDALGKSRSTLEVIWQRGSQWTPAEYIWRDPRYFQNHSKRKNELRIIDTNSPQDGLELPLYRYITHVPKLKNGLDVRGGLARLASLAYVCKMYSIKDWLSFAEVYGKPLLIARYGQSATPNDKSVLKSAIKTLGSDARAILPEEMSIDIEQAGGTGGGEIIFERLARFFDEQTSKTVLGQTMTTDAGSSKSQSETHREVKMELTEADAKQIGSTLTNQLVRMVIDLNFGVQTSYPKIVLKIPERQDLDAYVVRVEKAVGMGLPVSQEEIYKKLGITKPEDGADILTAPAKAGGSDFSEGSDAKNSRSSCKTCGGSHTALNRQEPDDVDGIIELLLNDWTEETDPRLAMVAEAVNKAESFEELIAMLPKLAEEMPTKDFANTLAAGALMSYGDGIEGEK
jgi:phage gp29-like protein